VSARVLPGGRSPSVQRTLRLAIATSLFASAVALAQPPAKPKAPVSRYASYVQRWHAASAEPVLLDDAGRPELVLVSLNTGDHVELQAGSDHGGFAASDLDRAAVVLRDTRAGNLHPIEPRLLDLVYAIETHFQARELRVLSGYRTPQRSGGSNHGKGRAIDLVVPGASDATVAEYARTLGFVGVGIYPTSGFVHVDVRDRSYFWSDASGPGRRNRERGILGDLAAAGDREALARGERPPPPFTLGLDVDAALRARGASVGRSAPPPFATDDEEEDDDATGAP
jgi:uncharacterized protein YcbK (DUF882 family)